MHSCVYDIYIAQIHKDMILDHRINIFGEIPENDNGC